jgi:general secretion pathway protein D
LLANPRIRVRNREKSRVMVGDKIPIVTTTSTATGFVADNIQYMDVGLKVELEPDIRLQGDIAIKVGLEVSSLGTQITTSSGSVAYQIGTRNANTVLRLKDGETQILAGLLTDEERSSGVGVPGLASVPLLGRLFGSRQDSHKKTEIVLSITPRLIRNLQRPETEQSEFWSGSESTLRTRPLRLQQARKPEAKESLGGGGAGAENQAASSSPNEPSAAAQMVALTWAGPSQVKPGEQFKLQLKLNADGVLRSLPFQAAFDPAVFQIVEISEGDFFKQADGTSSFSSNIDAAGGKFFVSASRTSANGAQGEGVAATVTLRALVANPKSDVTLLAVSPIADGGKTPSAPLPAPYSVAVGP